MIGFTDFDSSDYEPWNRQRSVMRYIESHGFADTPWDALDDDVANYQSDAPLVACDDGFRDAEEMRRCSGNADG